MGDLSRLEEVGDTAEKRRSMFGREQGSLVLHASGDTLYKG
jgi:hypothetical protein